jgi:hypothetical protein
MAGLSAPASGCDDEIDNRNGTTTYVDTTAPDAVSASWTPAFLRVLPRGTPTTRLLVRFVETCSGVADATAIIRNVTTGARYAVDLDLFTFDVKTGNELWAVHLTSKPADAGNWVVQSVAARDISRRFTVSNATGQIVGTPAPGTSVVDATLASAVQVVRRATLLRATVAPASVVRGRGAVVSGTLKFYSGRWHPVARARVYIQYRAATGTVFRPLASVLTDAAGRYRLPVRPTRSTVYRVRYAGGPINAASTSNLARVTVR